MKKQHYAIIDIGSNTMRLVIYEKTKGNRLKEIENVKASSRLRTFLEEDNTLNQAGIDRLIDTLKSFQKCWLPIPYRTPSVRLQQLSGKQRIKKKLKPKSWSGQD